MLRRLSYEYIIREAAVMLARARFQALGVCQEFLCFHRIHVSYARCAQPAHDQKCPHRYPMPHSGRGRRKPCYTFHSQLASCCIMLERLPPASACDLTS